MDAHIINPVKMTAAHPPPAVKGSVQKEEPAAQGGTDSFRHGAGGSSRTLGNLSANTVSATLFGRAVVSLSWKKSIESPKSSPPAIGPDGNVYMGTSGGSLMKLNVKTGAEEWQTSEKGREFISPPVFNDRGEFITLSNHQWVSIFDSTTGSKKHEVDLGWQASSAPIGGLGDTVILKSAPGLDKNPQGSLFAVDPGQTPKSSILGEWLPFYQDQKVAKQWEVPLITDRVDPCDERAHDPLQLGTMVFCRNGKDTLTAIDGVKGQKTWQFSRQYAKLFWEPFGIDENTVGVFTVTEKFQAASDYELVALDAKTGKKLWSMACDEPYSPPVSDGHGTVFCKIGRDTLTAIKEGSVLWEKDVGFSNMYTPPVLDGCGRVYLVSRPRGMNESADIQVFSGDSGDQLYEIKNAGDVCSPPVVSGDGGRILLKTRCWEEFADHRYFLQCYETPFNMDLSSAAAEQETVEIDEESVRVGGVKLDINQREQ